MQTYKINEPFETSGLWYLPQSKTKLQGTLKYNSNTIELSLDGSFQKKDGVETKYDNSVTYPIIHGECNGQYITLIDIKSFGISFQIGKTYSIKDRLMAQHLIIGAHADSNSTFPNMNFTIPSLEVWHARLQIQDNLVLDKNNNTGTLTVKLNKNEREVNQLSSIDSDIHWNYNWSTNGPKYKNYTITTFASVSIVPKKEQSIEWFLKERRKITMMLTFLAGTGMSPNEIYSTIGKSNERIDLLIAIPDQDFCNHEHPNDFFMNKNEMGIELNDAIVCWFETFESHPKILTPCLLASNIFSTHVKAHYIDFLILTQALEGIHRALYEGNYMLDEDYDKVSNSLNLAIPDNVKSDHRAALKSRIKYGNQISLRKRLKELAGKINLNIRKIVFGTDGKLPGTWVETRNYFTHWDEEMKDEALNGESLYYANVRLRCFLQIMFLIRMKIPQESILLALNNSSTISNQLRNINAIQNNKNKLRN